MAGILHSMLYAGNGSLTQRIINSPTPNYNLYNDLVSAGWDEVEELDVTVTISSTGLVYSLDTTIPAFDASDSFPAGMTLRIENVGGIHGAGGQGGGGSTTFENDGKDGGDGLDVTGFTIAPVVDNVGNITGGGGGGGRGEFWEDDVTAYNGDTGGGGAGTLAGAGGPNLIYTAFPINILGNPGDPGSQEGSGGAGGTGGAGYDGGDGGDWGQPGEDGETPFHPSLAYQGGAAGTAVVGTVTYETLGAINGISGTPDVETIVIASNQTNWNLYNHLDLVLGWDKVTPVDVTVTINAGVVLTASDTSRKALFISNLPEGSTVHITNNGHIVGAGGEGGTSSDSSIPCYRGTPGLSGGDAIEVINVDVTIVNNGVIGSGGGGGGAGSCSWSNPTYHSGGGGGGGAGNTAGTFGRSTKGNCFFNTVGSPGVVGTLETGGAGGLGAFVSIFQYGGTGGKGGDLGQAGSPGNNAVNGSNLYPSNGGAAGRAVIGDSNITWSVLGDVRGARI